MFELLLGWKTIRYDDHRRQTPLVLRKHRCRRDAKTIQDRIRELDKIVTIHKGALCTIAVMSADAATKDFMSPKKFCPRPTTERGENLEYPHSP